MRSPKELTRSEIIRAANAIRTGRKAKWTVIVDNRELPARPLVLEAAGVPPNDPTNSHQAVAILKRLGFETRYSAERDQGQTLVEDSSQGEGLESIATKFSALAQQATKSDWDRVPSDLAKNVDSYLYGRRGK